VFNVFELFEPSGYVTFDVEDEAKVDAVLEKWSSEGEGRRVEAVESGE
jgi:hypothetical protein